MGCADSRTDKPLSGQSFANPFSDLDITRADRLIRKFSQTDVMTIDQFNAAIEGLGLHTINIKDCPITQYAEVPGGVSRNGLLVAAIMSGHAPALNTRIRLLFDISDDQCEGQVSKEKLRMLIALMIKASVVTSQDGQEGHLSVLLEIEEDTMDALALAALNLVMASWTEISVSFMEFSRTLTTDALRSITTIDGMRHYLTTGFDVKQITRMRRGSISSTGNVTPSRANKLAALNKIQVARRRTSVSASARVLS